MTAELNTEKLVADLKRVVQDSEELLQVANGRGESNGIRDRLADALESAKRTCRKLEEKAVASAKATDKVIREHPYQSIGVAFGVGLLIGVLAMRKSQA